MAHWLVKTEPSTYSFADLQKDGHTVWDGVANAVALKNIRAMKAGDEVMVYHTGKEKRIVGLARVTRSAYADPKRDEPKLAVADLAPVRELDRSVTLAEIKADARFADWELVRLSRLSVMPVSAERWKWILQWS